MHFPEKVVGSEVIRFGRMAVTNIKGGSVPAALTGTCVAACECVKEGVDGGGKT